MGLVISHHLKRPKKKAKGNILLIAITHYCFFLFSTSVFAEDWGGKLIDAAKKGDLQSINYAIQNGAYVDVKNNEGLTALHLAANIGHLEVVKLVIEKWADVNVKDNKAKTPLKLAIEEGKTDAANYLKSVGGKE
jgi:ankyrin repeat protein